MNGLVDIVYKIIRILIETLLLIYYVIGIDNKLNILEITSLVLAIIILDSTIYSFIQNNDK